MPPIVVTATRSPKPLEEVAVPTTIVPAEQIAERGALRLSDVLEELTGLSLIDDHGVGVQIQGFASEYTLLLLDGEPIIGRTAGTLDLDRISVAGIERVEIVQGPSSSLYGSEALAGVINLITHLPTAGVTGALRSRYGTNRTADLTAGLEAGTERLGVRAFINRYSSDGYDLNPAAFGSTTPRFADYTADFRLRLTPTSRTTLRTGGRLAWQHQESSFALYDRGAEVPHMQNERLIDWSLHQEVRHRLSNWLLVKGILYAARYRTKTRMKRQTDAVQIFVDDFDQRYGKAEVQAHTIWNARHLTTIGGGFIKESLAGNRYGSVDPKAQSFFVFTQHEWVPRRFLELNVSARLDAHSDYNTRLSPKASLLLRLSDRLRLRASLGSGFKAPDFRQRYLNFTNAAVGYSVLGSTQFANGLRRFQEDGLIREVFIQPGRLKTIRAESSVALNLGLSATPVDGLRISLGLFLNQVKDLIETQPVALKANGSFVYSYFNLDRIYTRGIETEWMLTPLPGLSLTMGYQFLQARDRDVIEAIRGGRVFGRDEHGRDFRLSLSDYGGLFGRSTHSGVIRLAYRHAVRRFKITLRGVWRGRYGYRDIDGNAIPNRDDEFVPGYVVWNVTLTKDWFVPLLDHLSLQLGANNLLGITKPMLIPSLPGRTVYAGLHLYL